MGFKHYGVKTGGIPVDYIKRFVDEYNIEIFIETGTAGGESVTAVAPFFKECHTIEIVGNRANVDLPNVTLYNGDSAKLLKQVSEPFKGERIVFWLDAHWSEPYESQPNESECPILEEIEAIRGHRALILIDDARLFYGRPPWPCNPDKWPRFMFVFDKLRGCFPDHIISIVDDYIICFPDDMRPVHQREWYENYNNRFPTEEVKVKQSVKLAWEELMNYMQ